MATLTRDDLVSSYTEAITAHPSTGHLSYADVQALAGECADAALSAAPLLARA